MSDVCYSLLNPSDDGEDDLSHITEEKEKPTQENETESIVGSSESKDGADDGCSDNRSTNHEVGSGIEEHRGNNDETNKDQSTEGPELPSPEFTADTELPELSADTEPPELSADTERPELPVFLEEHLMNGNNGETNKDQSHEDPELGLSGHIEPPDVPANSESPDPIEEVSGDTATSKIVIQFLRARCTSLFFKSISILLIGFEIYMFIKKLKRDHYGWLIASWGCFIVHGFIEGIYSCYLETKRPYSVNSSTWYNQEDGGFDFVDDQLITADHDSAYQESIGEEQTFGTGGYQSLSLDRTRTAVTYLPNRADSEPGIGSTKCGECGNVLHIGSTTTNREHFAEAISNVKKGSAQFSIVGLAMHFTCLSGWYRWFSTSKLLWDHLKELANRSNNKANAIEVIQLKGVKKVCYVQSFNEFCHFEMVRKELIYVASVIQAILVIVVESLYWSIEYSNVRKFSEDKKSEYKKFDYKELIPLILVAMLVSYRGNSLRNQVRKLNYFKADYKFKHVMYLTLQTFVFLIGRIFILYFVMALTETGMVFTISIILMQTVVIYLLTNDVYVIRNPFMLFVSSLIMIFVYIPSPVQNKNVFSIRSYMQMIALELILLLVFCIVDVRFMGDIEKEIIFMGQISASGCFKYLQVCIPFSSVIILFILFIILNKYVCSTSNLTKIDQVKIEEVLVEANDTYHTEFYCIKYHDQYEENLVTSRSTIFKI